jgi:hypothetical protein
MDEVKYKKKIVVGDGYSSLASFVQAIPESFGNSGEVIYHGRNEVRKIFHNGHVLVVKSFKKPNPVNRFAYTYVRKSKAERSYHNSLHLLSNGIDSPTPVAFVNCYEKGLINKSYYISLYTDYASLESVVGQDISKTAPVMRSFGEFAYEVHTKGIYHKDFNVTNVLFAYDGGNYSFLLIDNNRMSFGKYKINKSIHNLKRLTLGADYFGIIAKAYAKVSGEDELLILKKLSSSRFGFIKKIKRKQLLKRIFRR